MTWHLYIIRTMDGSLYAGITTDIRRRYREHAAGGPKAARYLRANPPMALVFKRRIGTRSLALKAEYCFKRLPKRDKEAIITGGRLRLDSKSGRVRPPTRRDGRNAARGAGTRQGAHDGENRTES